MRVVFFIFFLQMNSICFSEKIKHVISLGPNCINSFIFSNNSLRVHSLPLDWMITPSFKGIHLAFEEDFMFFVDPQYLKYHNPGMTENIRYGFVMNHFFEGESFEIKKKLNNMEEFDLSTFLECLEPVKMKMNRRVHRLLDILNSNDQAYFFRLGKVDYNQLIAFRNLIASKYPLLDFTIVISDGEENPYYAHELPNIRYFHLEYPDHDLQKQASHPQWKNILRSLTLIQ